MPEPEPIDPATIDWDGEFARSRASASPSMRECPWCKSTISAGARVCPNCRRQSPPAEGTAEANADSEKARNSRNGWIALAAVTVVLWAILLGTNSGSSSSSPSGPASTSPRAGSAGTPPPAELLNRARTLGYDKSVALATWDATQREADAAMARLKQEHEKSGGRDDTATFAKAMEEAKAAVARKGVAVVELERLAREMTTLVEEATAKGFVRQVDAEVAAGEAKAMLPKPR